MLSQKWIVSKSGSIDHLRLTDFDVPKLGSDEVLIEVRSIGLNFADIFAILGMYSATPKGAFTPGLEVSGVILSIGKNARTESKLRVGQKVMALTRFGGYTKHLTISYPYVQPLPSSWSFDQGAAYPVQALTAIYAIETLGDAKKGGICLVHSAAGGVGLLALEILKKKGLMAIPIVGSDAKISFLRERFGFKESEIIIRGVDFAKDLAHQIELRQAKGLDLVLDSVAGDFFQPGFELLNPGGRYVIFGSAQFMPNGIRPNYFKLAWQYFKRPRLDPLSMISQNRAVLGFNLIWLWDKIDELKPLFGSLKSLKLRPPHVDRIYRFDQAKEAVQFFQSGKSVGKVIISGD